MSPGEFALYWSRIKSAMVGCDDAVAAARHVLSSDPDLAGPALRKVQSRCAAAAVDVGLVEPPSSARGLALGLLQEGRDACQRSMVEKQVAMEAIEQLMAGDLTHDLRETGLRVDAIDRSSLSCRATFTAAAKAARAPTTEYELLF